jgi:tetratricopeptide (TPR) repeat protein
VLIFGSTPHLETALEELARARALEPGDAHIQAVYALTVGALGRRDALEAANRAVALDPLNPDPHNARAAVLYWQRRYAEGLASAQTAMRLDDHLFYRMSAFMLLYALGRDAEALELTRNDTDDWEMKAARAMVHGRLGHWTQARAELKAVQDALGDEDAYLYADIYAQWGERDEALKWLETAVRVASGTREIRVDPLLDPLRSLPRFKALEARVALPR